MSDQRHEPQELLESLLSPEESSASAPDEPPPPSSEGEDVDALIDELETFFAEAKRVPFGKKLLIDDTRAMELVDRLRTALPAEVRQAQRILDEQDAILDAARDQSRRLLHERGLMAQLEVERERLLEQAEQEAERMRAEADVYVRTVLADLADRLTKIQASVTNGIEALGPAPES